MELSEPHFPEVGGKIDIWPWCGRAWPFSISDIVA